MSEINPILSPAQNLAANLDALHQGGHSYLDIPAQIALASGGAPADQTIAIADKIKGSIADNKSLVDHYYADAQQTRLPSVVQQVTSKLHAHFGTSITTENHVLKIQQDMVKSGAAPGLTPNGVWDTNWTSAAGTAKVASYIKPTTGNLDSKSTIQHAIEALSLSKAFNVIYNVAKAIPRETLQLMGDAVYVVGSGSSDPGTGKMIAQAFAKPENRTTDAAFEKKANSPQQMFQDAMTLLQFLPMATFAKAGKAAIAEAKVGGVLSKEAVLPKYTLLNSIVATSKSGTLGLIQPSSRAILNKPILNRIYKGVADVVATTAPAQIAIRDTLAQRLRLPAVRAANQIGLSAIGASIKLQAIAGAESKLGGREGALDSTVYSVGPITGPLAAALDIFSYQLNPGRLGTRALIGDTAQSAQALRNAFDDTGALRAWQRANPRIDYAEHIALHGEAGTLQEVGHQLNQMSVSHAADLEIRPLLISGEWAKMTGIEKTAFRQNAEISIWKDSAKPDSLFSQARESIMLDQNAMETGFRDIGSQAAQGTKLADKLKKGTSTFGNKIQANTAMEILLKPENAKYIIHKETIQELKAQKAVYADNSALAEYDAASGQGANSLETLTPEPKPNLSNKWVEANNPDMPDGVVGMARKESLTVQGAKALYNNLWDKYVLAITPTEQLAVRKEVSKSLLDDFGINVFNLGEHDTSELFGVLEAQGKKLSSDIHTVRGAPQEVKDALAKLDALGYKMVAGTDIGHIYTKALQFSDLGQADFTATAKVARNLGISPRLSDSTAVSARTKVETHIAIQDRIDSGKIQALPGFNSSRILSYLKANIGKSAKLTPGQEAVLLASKLHGNYDIAIRDAMAADKYLTKETAWAAIKQAKADEMGLREVDPKALREALTSTIPDDVAELMGLGKNTQFLDKNSADQVIQAIWSARVKVPLEMIGGLAKIEDILYAGLGIGNVELLGKSAMTIASVPAKLMNLRSRVRYQESIVFAYRRMVKTMAKGLTENIPPTLYPQQKLEEMGIAKEAESIWLRVAPEKNVKNAFLDDAERIVSEADFYNLYSPRDAEKWAAYWLNKQGFSDVEIAKKIENVVGYGERTAAERSLNAVFFPFSFNKTVMRQFGGFLLTHPGQRLVVGGIIDLYDQINGPEYLKWVEDNLPIIKQVQSMNALEHGIGLGGYGGINAPYAEGLKNLFTILGPKKIDYGKTSDGDPVLKALRTYVPMVKEFLDLFIDHKQLALGGQVGDTIKTVLGTAQSTLDKFKNSAPETDWNPSRHNLMPDAAQQNSAWEYRNRLVTSLSAVLDYNYQNPNERKVWPTWVPIQTGLQGKPITKASIGQLVHYSYPAWDNALSSSIAATKATEADRFIGEISAKNPDLGKSYRQFETAAKRVGDAVARDSVPLDKLAVVTDAFRNVAIQLADKDSNFAGFYKTHYERLFGPLEAFKP